jgi:hypothetical protein
MRVAAASGDPLGTALAIARALRTGPWVPRALATLVALFAAMGLRLALTPWLDDQVPELFAVPAAVAVSIFCGWRWGAALALMAFAWLLMPWLPPSWPDYSTGRILAMVVALAMGVGLGAAAWRGPAPRATAGRTHPLVGGPAALRRAMACTLALPLLLGPALAWISYHDALRHGRQQAEAVAALATEHVSRLVQANAIITRQLQARLAALSGTSTG